MDRGSDSPVVIVQRSPHDLPLGEHHPLADISLRAGPPAEHPFPTTTDQELPQASLMSQLQSLQAVQPSTLNGPSGAPVPSTDTVTMASNTVESATTGSLDPPSAPSPPSDTTETRGRSEPLPVTQAETTQEVSPSVPAETTAGSTQTVENVEPPQVSPPAPVESTTETEPQPSPPAASGTPPPPALVNPVTPPENREPPPPPQPSEIPEWINIEEDTSTPDEEELKAYEGRMPSISALDVKHHEEIFYPDIDDPEQRPVKKIRLTWVIKGVRGTRDKPNTTRVVNSPAAFVDGFYWSIRFFPRGNNASALSAYIKCTKKQPKPDSNPPESTFSFVQGGPDTDLSELKPEAELTTPPPVGKDNVVAPSSEDSKLEEDIHKNPPDAQNSRPAIASEGADKGAEEEDEEEGEDDEDEEEEDWRVSAQIGMIIYNPQEPRTKYDMSSEHQFNKHNDDWGWTNFHGPWTDIPRRRPGQYQALLRNDTIAMDAYIRVFEDPTQALWWHESQEYEKYWDSKSLAGYFPMGTPPLYHSPGVAGITAWLLLAPFRKILQGIDTSGWRRDSTIKPQPVLCRIQLVLYMMRKMKKEENYVNVNNILELMDMLGESYSDVISFWEAFRRSIELEVKDESAVRQISDIFDGRTEDGQICRHTDPIQIDVEKASSVQEGLEIKLNSLSEKQQFPKFLPIALARDKFDTSLREWKLLYNRVKLDEEIDVARWATGQPTAKYTLYGFVAHVGERSSGKFYSILRPNGPGTKWLAFEDGDGNKVFSYTKKRIQEFEGLEGEELKANKSTRQTAYLAMYIRTDLLAGFLPGALEPYQMPSWLRPYLVHACHSEDEPNDAGKESYDFETAIEIYPSTTVGSIKGSFDMYTLKDVRVDSAPPLKLTVPPETTYSQLRQKIAKWTGVDNVEKIRLWKMKLGQLGEHVTASMEKVRLHRPINGSGDSIRPLCLWMHLLQTEEDVKLYGDPDPMLDDDLFAKPIFDDEVVPIPGANLTEAAVPEDVAGPATDHVHINETQNAAESRMNASSATLDGEAAAALPPPPPPPTASAETLSAGAGDVAGPDAEQDAVANAVNDPVTSPVENSSPVPTMPSEPVQSTPAAPDAEQDAVAEAVNATVAGRIENSPLVGTGLAGQNESTEVEPTVQESTPRTHNTATEVGAMDRVVAATGEHRENNEDPVAPAAAGTVEASAAGAIEENPIPVSSTASQTATPLPTEANTEVVPGSEPIIASVETTASEGRAPVPREGGSTSDVPMSTVAEDQAASEAVIAALIVADLQAIDGEQLPPDSVNVDITPAAPLRTAPALTRDVWDIGLTPPPQQTATADDIVDNASEGSSANDEPSRPVPHVYGFIQLFDAVKQEFRVHSAFFARECATIKETIREVLGYPEDKEFLVWTRHKSYRTAAISANSIFENLEFRSDGFVLIVGDVHSESTKNALLSEGKFTNPEQLSRYLWMAARNHPIQAFTGDITTNVFGTHFYSGPMLKGLYHGPSATHISSNGQTYNGPYVAGERSGAEGKMTYQNGDVYEGSWSKNERHGQGTFVEKRTGNKYVGGFENGKRWGRGTTYWEVADEEGDMCQICYSEEIDALFYDCGHVCACVECAKQVEACPICRKTVRHVVRMYRS